MAIQLSVAVRNARLDAIESAILAAGGTGCTLRIYTGSIPADCATAVAGGNTGTNNICTITLPAADFMASASGGSKAKSGTWSGTGNANAGTGTNATFFRLFDIAGTPVCHLQGTVSAPAGGGDLILDNVSIANNQSVTVSTFTLSDANA